MLSNFKNEQVQKYLVPTIVMILLALVSTLVAFIGGVFYINPDGIFHLTRFESIYQALAAGEWPSRLNFIGFLHQGSVITGMYPWLSATMFILPRFLFSPMTSLFIGFFIMNLLTIWFTWLMMRRLTTNTLLRWLGVVLYQFNGYHFIVMYSRVALGEAIGYMALPLILLGLIEIWNAKRWGWVTLGIGMAIVANGHMLSLILCTVMVAVFTIRRFVLRKMTWMEFWELVKAALLAVVLSAYTLFTLLQIMMQNTLMPPSVRWDTLTLPNYLWVTLTNDFKEYRDTTMGLVIGILMIVFLVLAFKHVRSNWAKWILTANAILLCCFNFILVPGLINSPLSTVQFSMRFLVFVAMFLTVGIVMYFDAYPLTQKRLRYVYVIMITVVLGGLCGTVQHYFETRNSPHTHALSDDNYFERTARFNSYDYILRDGSVEMGKLDFTKAEDRKTFNSSRLFNAGVRKDFNYVASTFDSVTWSQDTKKAGLTKLPVVGYTGVDYTVTVNGKPTEYQLKDGHLCVSLDEGQNTIVVSGK